MSVEVGQIITATGYDALHVSLETGWLTSVRRIVSPNQDERPPGMVAEWFVIHGISLPPGEYGGPWIDALFTNRLEPTLHPYFHQIHHLRVSAHVLIARDGMLTQYVPFHKRAWHAGISFFEGRSRCNDFTIGIELEGTDLTPYTEVQYQTLAALIVVLTQVYTTLSKERIIGHSDIAPGRKTDPGPSFDWQRLRSLLG
jgi:N-acetyl-anhydromuramoyl-L-alanine amidase